MKLPRRFSVILYVLLVFSLLLSHEARGDDDKKMDRIERRKQLREQYKQPDGTYNIPTYETWRPSGQSVKPGFEIDDYKGKVRDVSPGVYGMEELNRQKAEYEAKQVRKTTGFILIFFFVVVCVLAIIVFIKQKTQELESDKGIYGVKDDNFPKSNTNIA